MMQVSNNNNYNNINNSSVNNDKNLTFNYFQTISFKIYITGLIKHMLKITFILPFLIYHLFFHMAQFEHFGHYSHLKKQ